MPSRPGVIDPLTVNAGELLPVRLSTPLPVSDDVLSSENVPSTCSCPPPTRSTCAPLDTNTSSVRKLNVPTPLWTLSVLAKFPVPVLLAPLIDVLVPTVMFRPLQL